MSATRLQPPPSKDGFRPAAAAKAVRARLDGDDLQIIRELQKDGRQGVAEIADTLGMHRNTVSVKLKRLVDRKVINPSVYVYPPSLGFQAAAIIGLKVAPGEVEAVAGRLQGLFNVHNMFICLGRYDIVLWGLFRDQEELHSFITRDLGSAPGIVSAETMITLGMKKLSFTHIDSPWEQTNHEGDGAAPGLDDQDRAMILELQRDARQSAAAISRRTGINKNTVLARLRSLLDQGTVKAFIAPNAVALGYHVMVAVGISVSPGEIDAALEKLKYLENTQTLIVCTGRYNIMLWGLFPDMQALYQLVRTELGRIPGIRDAEVMVILRVAKNSFAYLAPASQGSYKAPAGRALSTN